MNDWMDKRMTEKNDIRMSPVSNKIEKWETKENEQNVLIRIVNKFIQKICYFRRENGERTLVTVCLTIDDTSDVKISFYFRQQNRHSSIIEKK